jgi:hypothetical protein
MSSNDCETNKHLFANLFKQFWISSIFSNKNFQNFFFHFKFHFFSFLFQVNIILSHKSFAEESVC